MVDCPKDFKKYFKAKQGNSRRRGIDWQISLEECWSLWQPYWLESSQYQTQGYRRYCLARNGDRGPYSRENCSIKTHSENSQERWQTNRNYKAGLGDKNMQAYVNQPRPVYAEGRYYASAGEAATEHGIHRTTAHNRCQSRNFPDWQYV